MPTKATDERNFAFRKAIGGYIYGKETDQKSVAVQLNVAANTITNWLARPETISLGDFRRMAKELRWTDEEILKAVR